MMPTRRSSLRPKASAYDKALGLLARREHSRLELRRKLGQGGYAPDEIHEALARLEVSHYQDDQRFGEAMLRNRVQQGYGPLRIRVELRSHGLGDRAIAELLDAAEVDWRALARQQLVRHFGSAAATDVAERQRRAHYLQRRGFSGEMIRAADQGLAAQVAADTGDVFEL
ncbi:regulatory protein RecX [Frateuria aurantia]